MEEAMESSAPSSVGKKQLQGVGEVQTAIKNLQDHVDASKVSWGEGLAPSARTALSSMA